MPECTYCERSGTDVKALRYGRESILVCPPCWRRLKGRTEGSGEMGSMYPAESIPLVEATETNEDDLVRRVRIENASMVVAVEPDPENIHRAIEDALAGADAKSVHYRIDDVWETEPYGNETYIGTAGGGE